VCAWPASPEPFRIEPIFSPRLWGSRSLAPLYPEKNNLAEPLGEAWLTGVDCKIATGPFAGKMLGEAWPEMGVPWRGEDFQGQANFPLLLKFIFPKDKLSIQVHPDDAYAAKHELAAGGRGKTEMWHIVSADSGARLLAGLRPGVTKENFKAALAEHKLEELFQVHEVHAGDTFFIPAGTPHTIGPGMIVCEVQEYSDLTYRIYDYGRVDSQGKPRELHIDKALQVMKFDDPSLSKVSALRLPGDRGRKTLLAGCSYFAAEKWEFRTTVEAESLHKSFELFVILEGSGYIHWRGSPLEYRRGQCWFIPASLGNFSLLAEQGTAAIRAYVPNLRKLQAELRRAGFSESQLAQTVFA
jgi:mannose-6-phosphate isomerase